MRVTKTVKEYIQKEVTTRMQKRYADEAAEAKRRCDLKESIEEAALCAAAATFEKYILDAIRTNDAEDFLQMSDYGEEIKLRYDFHSTVLELKDKILSSSVLNWRTRMNEEIKEKVDEIIVTLELGGTKAELMEMLSKI